MTQVVEIYPSRTRMYYTVNRMSAEDVATQEALIAPVMALAKFLKWIIHVLLLISLKFFHSSLIAKQSAFFM